MLHFFLTMLLLIAAADDAGPVAMVLTTKGTVSLERGMAKSQPLRAMDLVRSGDRIAATDGEAVLVFLDDGRRERLKPKSLATVSEKGCTPASAVERQEGLKVSAAHLASLRDLARSGRAGVGVLRGDPPALPQVVTPMYGATVLTDRPPLSWPAAEKSESYRVELFSGDGKRVLWRATTKEPHLTYPEKEMALKRGSKCLWRVAAKRGEDKEERIVDSKFSLATETEADELAEMKTLVMSKAPADWLLAAAAYEAHGVYDQALVLYEKLAEKSPQEANYQVALASYYDRAGRADKAKAAREKAKKLGVGMPEK